MEKAGETFAQRYSPFHRLFPKENAENRHSPLWAWPGEIRFIQARRCLIWPFWADFSTNIRCEQQVFSPPLHFVGEADFFIKATHYFSPMIPTIGKTSGQFRLWQDVHTHPRLLVCSPWVIKIRRPLPGPALVSRSFWYFNLFLDLARGFQYHVK